MTRHRMETEVKVGIFVAIGAALTMAAVLLLGSTENIFSKKVPYVLHVQDVEGLITGAKVMLGGIQIGTVSQVGFDAVRKDARVDLSVAESSARYIKTDSEANIATQGVLGDRFVSISPGSDISATLPPGSDIPNQQTPGISQFLSQGDQLVVRLNDVATSLDRMLHEFESGRRSERFFEGMSQTATNLASASDKLNHEVDELHFKKIIRNVEEITDKLNNGNGTFGALINDPELYDNVKSLIGEVNRNRIMRNLVRQTLRDSETNSSSSQASPGGPGPAGGKQ